MAESKPISFDAGTPIGAWKVSTRIGGGGQGTVWAVKAARSKRMPQRALKGCFAEDPQSRARFVREVEILRRCDSPFILKVYDQDLEWKEHVPGAPPFAYYVCEKYQGSLEQRQKELGDARHRLALFRQACAAVTYVHTMAEPNIHRDIKPANFLITEELKNVVLADFGIARPLSFSDLTEAFEVVGTPYYRAPEVSHGERGSVRSDVYCMGRLLEWLLTNEVSTVMATRPIARGGDLDDAACDLLDRIIATATQIDAANRFASVQEMAEQVPNLWLSTRPKPRAAPVAANADPESIRVVAAELARTSDHLGWRQLENELRREFVQRVSTWRAENERAWVHDGDKDLAFPIAEKLLDASMARIVFSLVGVFSGSPAFADQHRFVEDIAPIPGWTHSGSVAIASAPRALLFAFHHLHGALALAYGNVDLALRIAESSLEFRRRPGANPLWKHRDVTGAPELLGGRFHWAWEFLLRMYERWPVLQHFFALRTDFETNAAAYSMVLVLHELATDAAKSPPPTASKLESSDMEVPAMFILSSSEAIAAASRRVFGNRVIVDRIAENARAKHATMLDLWPSWKKLIEKFYTRFDHWGFSDGVPFCDLV